MVTRGVYLSGALLKEAIDDLEWAAAGGHQSARSAVHLVMRRDPKALTLFAKGAGELKVNGLVHHMASQPALPVPIALSKCRGTAIQCGALCSSLTGSHQEQMRVVSPPCHLHRI